MIVTYINIYQSSIANINARSLFMFFSVGFKDPSIILMEK